MADRGLSIIRQELKAYADRGVFRSFAEEGVGGGEVAFQFLYLGQNPMTLLYAGKEGALTLKDMLPEVSADMFSNLKAFLQELFDPGLPEHRRINPALAKVRFVKRRGNVSVVFEVKNKKYKYGVNKLINLISWIHTYLQSWYPIYLWEILKEPQE